MHITEIKNSIGQLVASFTSPTPRSLSPTNIVTAHIAVITEAAYHPRCLAMITIEMELPSATLRHATSHNQ